MMEKPYHERRLSREWLKRNIDILPFLKPLYMAHYEERSLPEEEEIDEEIEAEEEE